MGPLRGEEGGRGVGGRSKFYINKRYFVECGVCSVFYYGFVIGELI